LVGLSGGVDSALVAALAVDALGPEAVWGVGMPSRFSSEHSLADARQLAENLGIRFEVLPIEPIFSAFLSTLDPVFRGTAFGVAEENIQARIRGNLLMALSNKFNSLVLTTGNKSELAVGYCTLYGDMSGGLAVISDLLKTRVYELVRFINRERERIPERSIMKPPSAELRPGQLDTYSLPSYDLLDPIVKAYVEEGLHTNEIIDRGQDPELTRRIVRMIDRNEYKRQQAPLGLKVTGKAFGSGRRMPIARGDWS
jgi:NAD+ synthase (glutamine-hydrolysing)